MPPLPTPRREPRPAPSLTEMLLDMNNPRKIAYYVMRPCLVEKGVSDG